MDVLVAAGRRWRSVSDSIREEMDPRRFDAYLDAVAAFPVDVPRHSDGQPDWRALPIESIRVRRWGERRPKVSAIHSDQVISMRDVFPRMMRIGYEIEDPWQRYTAESTAYMDNAGIRKLSAFMDAIWQNDERRHPAVFRQAYLAVTGEADLAPNPHYVGPVLPGDAAFERHIYARLNAELGASAAYTVFASHARDELADCILNVAGDEFRHLAIFWAAVKWRFGEGAYARIRRWLQHLKLSASGHRRLRTGLDRLGVQDLVVIAEVTRALALEVRQLLRWDETLTPPRLHDVFGCLPPADSGLEQIAA